MVKLGGIKFSNETLQSNSGTDRLYLVNHQNHIKERLILGFIQALLDGNH